MFSLFTARVNRELIIQFKSFVCEDLLKVRKSDTSCQLIPSVKRISIRVCTRICRDVGTLLHLGIQGRLNAGSLRAKLVQFYVNRELCTRKDRFLR
jgi:hypothetical protein